MSERKPISSTCHVCRFSVKTKNLFSPDLLKNGFWGWNFKNLSLNSESAPPRCNAYQFSAKTDNFEFFGLNLGKLPIYVQYFNEGVEKSSVEAEMSWAEVSGAGWS